MVKKLGVRGIWVGCLFGMRPVSQNVATALDIGKHHSPAELGRETAEILEPAPKKPSARLLEGQADLPASQELPHT